MDCMIARDTAAALVTLLLSEAPKRTTSALVYVLCGARLVMQLTRKGRTMPAGLSSIAQWLTTIILFLSCGLTMQLLLD
jgi:hypothetical protein